MSFDVTPEEFALEVKSVVGLSVKDLKRAAYSTALRGVRMAVRVTNRAELVDRGVYKNSWEAARMSNGAEFGNTAPYAAVIEYGRRPGAKAPPYAAILDWVRSKLVGNGEIEEWEAEGVAKAIQISIGRKGTPAVHVLGGLKPKIVRAYRSEAFRLIRKRMGG